MSVIHITKGVFMAASASSHIVTIPVALSTHLAHEFACEDGPDTLAIRHTHPWLKQIDETFRVFQYHLTSAEVAYFQAVKARVEGCSQAMTVLQQSASIPWKSKYFAEQIQRDQELLERIEVILNNYGQVAMAASRK